MRTFSSSCFVAATAVLLACLPVRADSASVVGVYLSFDSAPEAAAVEIMKRAVERLLKPSGVNVAWRGIGESNGSEAFADLAVLRFRGSCETTTVRQAGSPTFRLAATESVKRNIRPYTEVECNQVRKAMAFVPQGADEAAREKALGLALGRVVAHELYHILSNSGLHASRGIAKATQLLSDLVSMREMDLDRRSSRAIHIRLTKEK